MENKSKCPNCSGQRCPNCGIQHVAGEYVERIGDQYDSMAIRGKKVLSPPDVDCSCGAKLRHAVPIIHPLGEAPWVWRVISPAGVKESPLPKDPEMVILRGQAKIGVEAYIRRFTEKEDNLKARAKAVGLELTERLRNWRTWIQDSVMYLSELREAVELAEEAKKGKP